MKNQNEKNDDMKIEIEIKKNELKSNYKANFKLCEHVFPPSNAIPEHLGEMDAINEWENDTKGAYERFLNIGAYQRFKENGNIVLVGRTGTGKSAIPNRYRYAVENREIEEFDCAIFIPFRRIFDTIKTYEFNDESNAIHYICDIINLVIKLKIYQFIVFDTSRIIDENSKLKRCLLDFEIGKNTEIIEYLCYLLDLKFRNNVSLKEAVTYLKEHFYSLLYSVDITSKLANYLQGKKIVILADSVDYYDITEQKIVIINRALVELAFEYYSTLSTHKILLKVAIPSEVYKHIFEKIAARRKEKVVVIEWSYKDIIKMLAIRTYYFFKMNSFTFANDLIEKHKIKDFYDYEIAKSFLNKILPINCHSCIGVSFETIPYCIRHTQKKPRQILKIFNSLIDKICEEKNLKFFIDNEESIRVYIHRAQEAIINDALSMYNSSTKDKVLNIVSYVLENKRNFMSARVFNNAIKEAITICNEIELSPDDVKHIIIESGLVGQVYEEHFVDINNSFFGNKNIFKICIVIFEYQTKYILSRKNNTVFVLHPMCYEYYGNYIDYNALVYPTPANDEDDNIIDKLRKDCIIY